MYKTLMSLYIKLPSVFLAPSGLLLIFMCSTKRDKVALSDDTGTGGMLLKSNTEAPGEEVVRDVLSVNKPSLILHIAPLSIFKKIECAVVQYCNHISLKCFCLYRKTELS